MQEKKSGVRNFFSHLRYGDLRGYFEVVAMRTKRTELPLQREVELFDTKSFNPILQFFAFVVGLY